MPRPAPKDFPDASHELGLDCGQLFCNPIPWDFELDTGAIEKAVRIIFKAARKKNKRNKEDVGNIISNVRKFGAGRGEAILAERALLLNNASMGAQIAIELSKLEGFVIPLLDYTFFYRGGYLMCRLFSPRSGPGRVESFIRPLPFVNNKRLTPITSKSFEEDPDSYDGQFDSKPFDSKPSDVERYVFSPSCFDTSRVFCFVGLSNIFCFCLFFSVAGLLKPGYTYRGDSRPRPEFLISARKSLKKG